MLGRAHVPSAQLPMPTLYVKPARSILSRMWNPRTFTEGDSYRKSQDRMPPQHQETSALCAGPEQTPHLLQHNPQQHHDRSFSRLEVRPARRRAAKQNVSEFCNVYHVKIQPGLFRRGCLQTRNAPSNVYSQACTGHWCQRTYILDSYGHVLKAGREQPHQKLQWHQFSRRRQKQSLKTMVGLGSLAATSSQSCPATILPDVLAFVLGLPD